MPKDRNFLAKPCLLGHNLQQLMPSVSAGLLSAVGVAATSPYAVAPHGIGVIGGWSQKGKQIATKYLDDDIGSVTLSHTLTVGSAEGNARLNAIRASSGSGIISQNSVTVSIRNANYRIWVREV